VSDGCAFTRRTPTGRTFRLVTNVTEQRWAEVRRRLQNLAERYPHASLARFETPGVDYEAIRSSLTEAEAELDRYRLGCDRGETPSTQPLDAAVVAVHRAAS
jgi:hypothetical protein